MLVVKDPKLTALVPACATTGTAAVEPRPNYWTPAMGNGHAMLDGDMLWPNNYCLGEIECALGVKMLERIDRINAESAGHPFHRRAQDYPELEFLRENTATTTTCSRAA